MLLIVPVMRDDHGNVIPACNKPALSSPAYCLFIYEHGGLGQIRHTSICSTEFMIYNSSNVLAASNRIMSDLHLTGNATENGPHVPADVCEKCSLTPRYTMRPIISPPLLFQLVDSRDDVDGILAFCEGIVHHRRSIGLDHPRPRASDGKTALMRVCEKGQLRLVQWLLEHGANVNTLDNNDRSALYYAIQAGNIDIVKELLHYNPVLNPVDRELGTPLAAAIDHPDIPRLLLNAGADPNISGQQGRSPIFIAAMRGSAEVIQDLIRSGADLHSRDDHGWTPICAAVDCERDDSILRALVDGGANVAGTITGIGSGLLHLAVFHPPHVMRLLLEFAKRLNPNQRNSENLTPFSYATNLANIASLTLLVNAGADIDLLYNCGETVLHNAIAYQMSGLRDLLLAQPEIEVNRCSTYFGAPLHLAARRKQLDSVTALLDRGGDSSFISPCNMYPTPLISALLPNKVKRDDVVDEVVRNLILSGVNVRTTVPSTFYNALAAACYGANPRTIIFLIDRGGFPNSADPISGRLPIHFAAASGMVNFQTILPYRGDMMATDNHEKNCLNWAARFGNSRTVEYILSQWQSQPNWSRAVAQADIDGWTPLCWAVCPLESGICYPMRSERKDHARTVRILLQHGVSPTME